MVERPRCDELKESQETLASEQSLIEESDRLIGLMERHLSDNHWGAKIQKLFVGENTA